ncbi:MAG: ribose-5-phosphate isomerase RpiA [Alphaproteobacteria bacterium]|nr:ribose-5-phosphate isomerase RpiA [Alphaproteobacteria bacterium]
MVAPGPDRDALKRAAAQRAVDLVENGMVIGLGTGSTAAFVIEALGRKVAAGLDILAVPTSERSAVQARNAGIPLTSFAEHRQFDLAIDGADEVHHGTLDLIKGLGGALLREKIVASASRRFIVVVDQEKLVERLGDRAPVPVEIAQFGWQATAAALERLGTKPELRRAGGGQPFITDSGNYILDCPFPHIDDPGALECRIAMTVGVFESGLFVGRTSGVLIASSAGVEMLTPTLPPQGKGKP